MAKAASHLFIVNPAAGKGDLPVSPDEITSLCRSKGAQCEIRFTTAPGDAAQFASDGVKKGFARVVSVGGDGTSSEIAGALAGTPVLFGVIAAGSGNDFPSACGLPRGGEALDAVFSSFSRKVDMGVLDGKGFINGFGIGMDGAIAGCFPKYRFLGGFAGYLAAAIMQAFEFEGFSARLALPDSAAEGGCLLTGVSNGPTQGGFSLSPAARTDDGLLDFHFVRDMSALKRIAALGLVAAGKPGGRWIGRFQAQSGVIETSKDLPAHMDGEPFVLSAGRHEISIRRGALNLLCGAGRDS
ncbi:diacylglycerol/lipid kinase family protein [Candidatus Mycalebacterium sp.]